MRTHQLHPDLALALACLLALLLFLMGLVLPQAHLWGSFLVPIVVVFLWGRRRDIYVVTAIASVLLVAAYWNKPDATLGAFLTYHLVSLAILWGAAWLLAQRRQSHERLLVHERELDVQAKSRAVALAASEERFARLFNSSPVGITLTRLADGTFQEVNDAFIAMVGYSRAELIDHTILELSIITPDDRRRRDVALQEQGQVRSADLVLHTKGGEELHTLISMEPIDVEDEDWLLSSIVDITARKQAEAAIEAALVQEKELGELKSRFVSMASHEFRNPLAGILATTEALALLWDRMDRAKIDERLNRIRDQVLRLSAVTEDVLHLTRMQTGYGTFAPAAGDLDELCSRVVGDLRELPGYGDRICYDCMPRPLRAHFDALLLQQAIGNLLHNALKYSPPDKCVHITLAQFDGQVTLRIVDEGIGIPPADLPHLFEPFHRAANVGTIQGTGLGLAIAKEAVELHGGTVAVESRVGVGTAFIITLPGRMETA